MKSIKFTLLLLFISSLTTSVFGQVSGTFTVGGVSPDYATIQDAVSAVQAAGVNGPVIINIRPGTYFEKISIGAVAGVSSTNTITIKSENNDSTSVIITDTSSTLASNNQTFYIFGTDYLRIKNLTIERSGTNTYSTVFYISAGCIGLQITNNVITAELTTSTSANKSLMYFPLRMTNDTNAIISNNVFRGGSYQLQIQGGGGSNRMPSIEINNNVFDTPGYRAMSLTNGTHPVIERNTIMVGASSTSFRGIYLSDMMDGFRVYRNSIIGINGGDGIYLDTCVSTMGNEGLAANNFIQSQGTSNARGITLNVSNYANIYYNTVNITTTGTGTNTALNLNGTNNANLNVRNNIFVNTGAGAAVTVAAGAFTAFAVCDYNNFYAGSSPVLAKEGTNNFATLGDWQTASSLDANSVSGDPEFYAPDDLHVNNAVVNDNAVVIAGITEDFDGQSRSGSTPDIGADEFTPLADNIGLVGILLPSSGSCGDSATVFAVILRNYGLATQSGFTVDIDITGDITQSLSETYTGNLVSNQVDTLYFSQTINTYAGVSIDATFYTSLAGDQNHNNDTLMASYTIFGYPNPPMAQSPQTVCDNNAYIYATADPGDEVVWYDQPVGGNILYTGEIFHPSFISDTTFYIESRTGSGGSGCLRITEIQPDDNPSDYIEIQNLSSVTLDATGWVVAASLDNSNINNVNADLWQLGVFAPGEVQYRTDNSSDNYWGSNLLWTGGSRSWAMIVDNMGNIVDFVAWEYPADSILNMNVNINGFNITVGPEWVGNGFTSCSGPTSDSDQRLGNEDHDNASDWGCAPTSKGVQNGGITTPFINCGIGACGSSRVQVDVTTVPGITVSLGNDTMIGSPFAITLDAGAGYDSYQWSTGETTQTIVVSVYDTYWVTVTGGPDGCAASDSIVVSLNVGFNQLFTADEISFYPNPATDRLVVSGKDAILNESVFRIIDLQGRIVKTFQRSQFPTGEMVVDIHDLKEGVYQVQVVTENRSGVQRFVVVR